MSNDSRQRIIEAARELIYASSYADVGVASICEKAGVKKGSFYHFFSSKSDLTMEVLDSFASDFSQEIFDKAFTENPDPSAQIDRLVKLVYEFQRQTQQNTGHVLGCPFGNLATELSTTDEQIRNKLEHIFVRLQNRLVEQLKLTVSDTAFSNIDTDATAEAMLAYFEGVLLMAKTRNDANVILQLLPAIKDIHIRN